MSKRKERPDGGYDDPQSYREVTKNVILNLRDQVKAYREVASRLVKVLESGARCPRELRRIASEHDCDVCDAIQAWDDLDLYERQARP